MINKDIYEIVTHQLSEILNCNISDLQGTDKKTVVLTSNKPYNFCHLICFKNNLVASVDEKIKGFIDSFILDKERLSLP